MCWEGKPSEKRLGQAFESVALIKGLILLSQKSAPRRGNDPRIKGHICFCVDLTSSGASTKGQCIKMALVRCQQVSTGFLTFQKCEKKISLKSLGYISKNKEGHHCHIPVLQFLKPYNSHWKYSNKYSSLSVF